MRDVPGTWGESATLRELFRLEPLTFVPGTANHRSGAAPSPRAEGQPGGRPAAGQRRILIVEDDEDIARLLLLHLEDLDAQLCHAQRGDDALQLALEEDWDLIILDVRLPGMSGLDICRGLREHSRTMPIIMLTAKSSELDRVLGLELGADDYLTKPFSPLELAARAKAQLRRAAMHQHHRNPHNDGEGRGDEAQPLVLGPFSICTRSHSVLLNQKPVELTSREFDLLLHFARQPGRVFRRCELLDEVWGYGHEGYEHTVNTHINRLRSKIEDDPRNPRYVVTVWGVGYRVQAEG